MESLLAYLPFVVLLLMATSAVLSLQDEENGGWRAGVLSAIILWFAVIWLSTEVLSAFTILTQFTVLGVWIVSLAAVLYRCWTISARHPQLRLRGYSLSFKKLFPAGILIFCIFLISFAVAVIAPPNNNDSISYHLPRVLHWIQNRSVDFYPTVIARQLFMPPLAEYGLLQMVILGESDASLGLLQWICFAGAVLGVSLSSRWLGVGKRGQWMAALFAATLPMAILQSTSTQNDLVAAFFAIALLERILRVLSQKRIEPVSILWISLITALGMYTKGTFAAFCIPFLVMLGIFTLRREGLRKAFILASSVLLLTTLVSAPLWIRNTMAYGCFLGPEVYLSSQQGLFYKPLVLLSNLIKNFSFHLSTPVGTLNLFFKGVYVRIHELIGINLETTSLHQGNGNFSFSAFSNHEDLAGNPVHFLFFLVVSTWIILRGWKKLSGIQKTFAAFWALSWLFFSFLFPWQPWGSRLQLSLFILGAPLVAIPFDGPAFKRRDYTAAVGLFLLALPWLLFNKIRPVLGFRPYTAVPSVFTASNNVILYANRPNVRDSFTRLTRVIIQADCDSIGMEIDSSDPEYFLWRSVEAPFDGTTLEHIHSEAYPAREESDSSEICAVICMICAEDEETRRGLPLVESYGVIRFYAAEQP
ncbi:MAG: hypothetical protein JXA25_20725 [Anaerolineales bacterium]|nr:hypothetical protein [Anaerolineales bacterium]